MEKVFVIDNYDSFTYNLVHYLEELGCEAIVKRNDKFKLDELDEFSRILLSPGPGIPDESGLLKAAIEQYAPTKKILGICLGQQAIGEVFGAKLINLEKVYHGIATPVTITEDDLLEHMDFVEIEDFEMIDTDCIIFTKPNELFNTKKYFESKTKLF